MSDPEWFVQSGDGKLWAYYHLELLLIDLRIYSSAPRVIYRRIPALGKLAFEPCTEADLHEPPPLSSCL